MRASGTLTFPLIPRRRIRGLPFGPFSSVRRGIGSDLVGFRPYVPGDDARRIHQKMSARQSALRGTDDYMVQETYTEELLRGILVVDRRPAMGLYPATLPMLRKPDVIREAGRMILDSLLAERCIPGYLDYADALHPNPKKRGEVPFWRPPVTETDAERMRSSYLPYAHFYAPRDNLTRALHHLALYQRVVTPETMIFILSDFLAMPAFSTFARAVAHGWDIIPVIIQDPVFEQSFPDDPDIAGVPFVFEDPESGAIVQARFSKRELRAKRDEHERRLATICHRFAMLGVYPVVLATANPKDIHDAFMSSMVRRRYERR